MMAICDVKDVMCDVVVGVIVVVAMSVAVVAVTMTAAAAVSPSPSSPSINTVAIVHALVLSNCVSPT